MGKERLTAFSDGVLAIIITIMVLELRVPEGHTFAALRPLVPVLLSYVLSFIYIGIYWNNHHHMLFVTQRVNGTILWANMHLLFWLSLVPFVTSWMGEHPQQTAPTVVYGFLLFAAGLAYWLLQQSILAAHGPQSTLAQALGADFKGKVSPVLYLVAIALAWVRPWIADALFVLVALLWLLPDRRIEKAVQNAGPG